MQHLGCFAKLVAAFVHQIIWQLISLMGYNVLAKKVWGALSKAGDYRQAVCSALTTTLLFWEDVWPAAALLVHKQNAF